MFEAYPCGKLLALFDAEPAAIGCADQRAHAGAGNKMDGNFFFFEDFEDPDMRDPPGKAAPQSQSNAGHPLLRHLCRAPGKLASEGLHRANDFVQTLHGDSTYPGLARKLPTST